MRDHLQKLFTDRECDVRSSDLEWAQLLVPYVESALVHAGTYSSEEISGHVRFFLDHVLPYLGPTPTVDSHNVRSRYKPRFASSMTNDLTPFELSLCWKSLKQEYKPIVRLISDIIPSNLENSRVASLTQSINLIETLERASANENTARTVHVLPDLWRRISHAFRDHEANIHPKGDCPRCGPSSAFVGFDLNRSVISSKMYWLLPSCQGTEGALELLDRVFTSSALVSDLFASPAFLSAWGQIRAHVKSNPDILMPRMLSVDATTFPASRIKIYTRCLFNGKKKSFTEWERHLNLDGAITYPEEFRSTACNLWTSLATNPEEWIQTRPEAGPKYCLILYELTASSSSPNTTNEGSDLKRKLSSKLYIMCQEIPRKDSVIAEQLLRHCPLAARAEILRTFADASLPTNFISEIGLAPRKDGTEMSVYLSPSFFSRPNWEVTEDDYMSKCRVDLATL